MVARRLVVCCDGTWNKPRSNTNIYRTYCELRTLIDNPDETVGGFFGSWRSCGGRAPDGAEMLLYYHRGVGTTLLDWATGGVSGVGVSDNVCAAYQFLSEHYRPGDEVYLFGFSRGAYTARSLCGFLAEANGLLVDADLDTVRRAYLHYYVTRQAVADTTHRSDLLGLLDKVKARLNALGTRSLDQLPRHDVKVRFVGVYDTVGALGIPLPRAEKINEPIVGFHDVTLCGFVEHAVHALAVDERRGPFQPTLWRLREGATGMPEGQTCRQVWFPGVHSDVGGGYPDKGLGDIALDFMLRQAAQRGLYGAGYEPPGRRLDPLAPQHDSSDQLWDEASKMFRDPLYVRPVGPDARAAVDGDRRPVAGEEMVHESVVRRLGVTVNVVEEVLGKGDRVKRAAYEPPNITRPSATDATRVCNGLPVCS